MNAQLDIRPVDRSEHADACAELLVASEPWITLGVSREVALALFSDLEVELYGIHDTEGVAGFVLVDMRGSFRGYVRILYVRPDCRGMGLGSALLRWAEERILRDCPNVFICVSSFNEGARRLYERQGFTLVGVLREFVIAGHDELLLRKTSGTWAEFRARYSMRSTKAGNLEPPGASE